MYQQIRNDFESGNLPQALAESKAASVTFHSRPVWFSKFNLLTAEILIWQGQSKDALTMLDQVLPASNAAIIKQKSLKSIANSHLQHFDEAARLSSEAEQLASSKAPNLLADVYLSQGLLYLLTADYSHAEQNYLLTLELARTQKNDFLVSAALGSLGIVNIRQRHYDRAIDLFSGLREMGKKSNNKLQIEKADGNLGWCYSNLGNYDKALEFYTEAVSLSEQLNMLKDKLNDLNAMGVIHNNIHDLPGAEHLFLQALAISQKLDDKSYTAVILSNLALVAIGEGKLDEAEQYNQQALAIEKSTNDRVWLNDGHQTEAVIQQYRHNFPEAEKLYRQISRDPKADAALRWEAETRLAEVYAAQDHSTAADAHYRRALATTDAVRDAIGSEELRLSFSSTSSEFYDSYIDYLVARGRARDALRVAEHCRARTLSEGLGLKATSFRPELAAKHARGVVLVYWLKAGRSYMWAVTPQKVEVFTLPASDQIETLTKVYNKALIGPRDVMQTAGATGQQLYSILVAPAQKLISHASRIVIVPAESLHTLNFETLRVPSSQPHYWIEDVELTNAPSLELLADSKAERKPKQEKLLLIGDPVSANSDFPPLANAKAEIDNVQKHFPAQCTALVGKQATAQAYLSTDVGSYSYIHFGTHGTANRVSPLESSIILSPEGDDYKLYARQIAAHPLHAQLVTISACYGAGTRAYSGEGLVGLSWAFLRAGAHNVIAALWEVNDASTPQLMDAMYRKLSSGSCPSEALHAAKLEMLHSSGVYRRPFYWGAFQCYTGY